VILVPPRREGACAEPRAGTSRSLATKSGSLRGRGDARRIAAAAGAAVDVLVVRALDRVGARERLDRGRILGQARKQRVRSSSLLATTWMTLDSCCTSPVTAT
jgi:hypothetical protein